MSTDYSKMSDFEINGLIAKHTQKVGDFIQSRGLTFIHEYGKPVSGFGALFLGWKEFDPCNNPADAWPIIAENRIGIIPAPCYGEWKAAHRSVGDDSTPHHFTQHTNPLRAAMIVFLKMQESKNAS